MNRQITKESETSETTTLYDTIMEVHVLIHLFKPTDYATPTVTPDVN